MSSLPYVQALVTGASSGIGEAIARKLAQRGVHLVLLARSTDKLEALAKEFRTFNVRAEVLTADLIQPGAVARIWEETQRRGLAIDLLVNNAGFGAYGPFHESDVAKQLDMIRLNVSALVEMTHFFIQPMIRRKHGALIQVSSLAGFQPVPFMAAYAATKAFVTNFSLALGAELRDANIRVIDLCPGRTRTGFQLAAGSNKIRIRSRSATPSQVAEVAIDALERNRPIAIEGLKNKLTLHIQRFVSRSMALNTARKIFKPKPASLP